MRTGLHVAASLAAITLGAMASSALAAPAITVTPASDHPSAKVGVTGAGFGAGETIDIYFDTTDELLAISDANGRISKHTFKTSADTLPGQHWVTAVGRRDGDAAQKPFTASTTWAEFGFKPKGGRNNSWENVLAPSNVKKLDTAWRAQAGDYRFGADSSPAVANGIVYAGFDNPVCCSGLLAAFDATTGAHLWTLSGDATEASPAVANGTLYIGWS